MRQPDWLCVITLSSGEVSAFLKHQPDSGLAPDLDSALRALADELRGLTADVEGYRDELRERRR